MIATLLVAAGLGGILLSFMMLPGRGLWGVLRVGVVIVGLILATAAGPRAWVEVEGQDVQGVVAALEERAVARQRRGWWSEEHGYEALFCYRGSAPPGLGVEAPYMLGEGEAAASRICDTLPGDDPVRLTRIRYDEAAYDQLALGQTATLRVGWIAETLELAYPRDAPVLPWLPSWRSGSGSTGRATAEVVSVTVQERGVSRGGGSGGGLLSVPVAHVRLRYTPAGHAVPVEAIDRVDADWRPDLAAGTRVEVSFDIGTPRGPTILGAARRHAWRNALDYVLLFGLPGLLIGVTVWWWWRGKRAGLG